MAGSLGYFADEAEDHKVLKETFRLLIPQGRILLDLPDKEYVLENFKAQSRHEANEEIVVCRHRRRDEDFIFTREVVFTKTHGPIRDETYRIRLYSPERISSLLVSAGFNSVRFQKDFMSRDVDGDYGFMTNRMIVIAQKR